MGQSNAAGVNGTTPTGLSNVYCMSSGTRVWVPWNNDFNVGAVSTGKSTPGCEFAQLWQDQIDAGADLPDLYVLHCAASGEGLSTYVPTSADNRWYPVAPYPMSTGSGPHPTNTWNLEGVGALTLQSLYDIARASVSDGITALLGAGLTPRILGMAWVQGEKDSTGERAAAEYAELLHGVYLAVTEASGAESMPFFPVNLRIPNTASYAYQTEINDAFNRLVKYDARSHAIDPQDSVSWDGGDPLRGVYGSDALHYRLTYLQEIAQTIYNQTIGAGFYGYEVVSAPAEEDWQLYTGWDEAAQTLVPDNNPLAIGDAPTGTIRFTNNSTTRVGAARGATVPTGPYTLDKVDIGPLGPGEFEDVVVSVGATGSQSGQIEVPSSAGNLVISVTSALSYIPSGISGLVAAYDPTQLALADGASVSQWDDRFAGLHATPTTTNEPVFKENAFGTLPSVNFTGSSAQFDLPAAVRSALLATGEAEVWAVLQGVPNAVNGDVVDFGTRGGSGNAGLYTLGGSPAPLFNNFATTAQINVGTVPASVYTAPHLLRYYYRADTGFVGVEAGGVDRGSSAATFGLLGTLKLGGRYSTGTYFEGEMGEVLVFNRFLGDGSGDDATVRSYLQGRWGVT
jgi:hypothetical protein